MRILLLIPGPLGDRLSAPEVRGWNMAVELARRHEVWVAAPGAASGKRNGISLIPLQRRQVVRAARDSDAVIAPRVPPYLYAALAARPVLLVADMYNPAEVELAAAEGAGMLSSLRLSSIRATDLLQLRFADVVLCAVEAQRLQIERQIAVVAGSQARQPVLRVVPFGLDNDPPPPAQARPIRERFPGIGTDDVVVLWWGNVWRWFDAETALRAFASVARDIPRAKLVFTAGRPPRSEALEMDETETAKQLAGSLGLDQKSVFFISDWIPHSERQDYLQDADLGLTLHRDTPEKEVAARGRYLDYLWTSLPCVLGAGDELADRFAEAGFALTVTPGDTSAAETALRRLIADPQARAAARTAAGPLVEAFRWSAAVKPLAAALDELAGAPPRRTDSRRQLAVELGRVYRRRLVLEAVRPFA